MQVHPIENCFKLPLLMYIHIDPAILIIVMKIYDLRFCMQYCAVF